MKNRTLLGFLWTATAIIILVPLGSYILKFQDYPISDDPEKWGQFGDYLGGVLNPMLTIINLIILTYLSLRLVKDEDERNKWTLQELARPYCDIDTINKEHSLELKITNCGLGPLIINKIEFKNGEKTSNKIIDFLDLQDLNYSIHYLNLTNDHGTIQRDQSIILLDIIGKKEDIKFKDYLKSLKEKINTLTVEITYSDIYKRKIDTFSNKFNIHVH